MKPFIRTAVVAAALLLPSAALAQEGFRFTLGLKAWVHTWSTWSCTGCTSTSPSAAVGQTETDTETVLVPSLTMRFRNFFVSGDLFPEKEYDFLSTYRRIKREEWSIVGGYYIAPQLAVALGYKHIHQDFRGGAATGFDYNVDVTMFGLQGGAPVGDGGNWFIYGNGFVGPTSIDRATGSGGRSYDGWYYSTELGIGYRMFERLSATAGYKYQTVRWEEIEGKVPGHDYTAGWIFGLSFTF